MDGKVELAFRRAVADVLGLGTISAEKAMELIVQYLCNHTHLPRTTFFFPVDTRLEPISVRNAPPSVGDRVYLSSLSERNQVCWKVERVDWSLLVETSVSEQMRLVMSGLPTNNLHAQVQLMSDE